MLGLHRLEGAHLELRGWRASDTPDTLEKELRLGRVRQRERTRLLKIFVLEPGRGHRVDDGRIHNRLGRRSALVLLGGVDLRLQARRALHDHVCDLVQHRRLLQQRHEEVARARSVELEHEGLLKARRVLARGQFGADPREDGVAHDLVERVAREPFFEVPARRRRRDTLRIVRTGCSG